MSVRTWTDEEVKVAEGVVRVLEEAGIDLVFGMSGGNVKFFFDALIDHQSKIRTILVRHESLAGVMAEVYGRLTGKPGVAIGQGAFMLCNSLLGVLEGHLGSSPMLLIADVSDNAPFTHHAPYQAGTGDYGTWDAKVSFSGVTKATFLFQDPVQAIQGTQMGIKHAMTGECGPVALLYHSSVFRDKVRPSEPPLLYPTSLYLPKALQCADEQEVLKAAKVVSGAEFPVIIAGNGVRLSGAYGALQELAETLGAPVATTAAGKGVFPENHDLALGVFGTFGTSVANKLIGNADAIVFVGTKISPTDTAKENPLLLDPRRQKMVQVDIEPKNAGWTFPCEQVLVGDAKTVLNQLVNALEELGAPSTEICRGRKNRVLLSRKELGFFNASGFFSDEIPMLPERVIWELRQVVADDSLIACDAGENRLFMTHFFQTRSPNSFISPASVGGMGYAIPAALVAKLLYPDRQVIAVCGDGGFGMALGGMITAYEENIPIVTVIFNNQALGWVHHGQGGRPIASRFKDVNYAGMAKAAGCVGYHVESPSQFRQALGEALKNQEPAVLDVRISLKTTFRDVTSPLAIG